METRTREEWCELLGLLSPQALTAHAEAICDDTPTVTVAREPETGSIVLQVREPIQRQRFQLADMIVTTAEVLVSGERGWAMRPGTDTAATLAQAICEAELARSGPRADVIRQDCEQAATDRDARRAEEWRRVAATIVEFEEVL